MRTFARTHELIMEEHFGGEYLEGAQTRREDLAKAESQRAGLSTFVEIEESQEILSTSSEEEASDAPVAKPPGGAAMAE